MKKYLPFLFLMLLFTDAFAQTLKHSQQQDLLVRARRAEQEANSMIPIKTLPSQKE